ncbi:MAG: ribosome small subunit-dependent GTPase A [Treponema sp.]|nr:ribosome small subunit-dependent GTPase A [Treponema sp.]
MLVEKKRQGLVLRGSRNIFTVRPAGGNAPETLECRVKGKVLKGVEGFYNPLAPGDFVQLEADPLHPGKGLILSVEPRRNRFTRLNQKGQGSKRHSGARQAEAPQLLAANLDLVLCVATPASPPWRPRFLDRLLLQADIAGIPPLIICNKWDLFDGDPDIEERLEDFRGLGYGVHRVSVKTGQGLEELRRLLSGRIAALAGQSGVGKSSLVNALIPGTMQRTGGLNGKYDRGNHITSLSALLEGPPPESIRLVDTPGIRRLLPDGVSAADLILYLREFAPLAGRCTYGLSCSHAAEPGCKIMEAVAAGVIHEDRYESFLRIREELRGSYGENYA